MANPFLNTASKLAFPMYPLVTASVAASAHTASANDTLSPTLQDNTTAATFQNGILRIRTRAVSAACTTALAITFTDGTTTESIPIAYAVGAGLALELTIPIVTDLLVSSVTLAWTLGGTVGTGITVDAELFGN